MVNWRSKRLGDTLLLANGLMLVVFINVVAYYIFFRIDLTEENRYSLKPQTIDILNNLDDKVYIEVYLEGDLNAPFTRFQRSIRETLEEFRIYSNNRVEYRFVDPSAAASQKARGEFMQDLASKGVQPTNIIDRQNGQRLERIVFPGAIVSYGGSEEGVMLLKGNKANSAEQKINQSIEGVEFELVNAIYKLTNVEHKQIAFMRGHGEADSVLSTGLYEVLTSQYDVFDVNPENSSLQGFDAIIISKPTRKFPEHHKYAIDQYIMNGGKVLFLLDKLEATMDSATSKNYFAFPYNLDLDDQLFKYGVRINMDLIQDQSAGFYPVITGQSGSRPEIELMEWPYFPLLNRYADHPITRNIDAIVAKFVSSIDTVKAEGIKKTPLIFSSQYSRTVTAPVNVNIEQMREPLPTEQFNKSFIPVAYLLEGNFTSLFKNRFLPKGVDQSKFKGESEKTSVIVVSDGDIGVSQLNPRSRRPQPLGYDQFTKTTFGNAELILNMLSYLTENQGLIHTRTKEVKIRPLNRQKIAEEKLSWQIANIASPLVVLIVFGIVRAQLRKRKYARFK